MFNTLRNFLRRRLGISFIKTGNHGKPADTLLEQTNSAETHDDQENDAMQTQMVPYDPELLDRARMQWQFGEWDTLVRLDERVFEHHPERAKLALIVASASQQLNDHIAARRFIKLAQEWGCDKKLMAQLMIASVHNTLARAATINGDESGARNHFRLAVKGGGGDERLTSSARYNRENEQLRLVKPFQNQIMEAQLSASELSVSSMPHIDKAEELPANAFNAGIVSYAQNFEDVMLWRALGHIKKGFYIDVGAQNPIVDSVSKAFYEHGWRGIHVEPTPAYVDALRKDRPDETVISAAVSDRVGNMTFYEIPGTGISTGEASIAQQHQTRGFQVHEINVPSITLADIFASAGGSEIHWLKIDVEGMETQVLNSWGDSTARPWIVVVESTLPLTQIETRQHWENQLLMRGYKHVYFDGLNRFYLNASHIELTAAFASGPNVFDGFVLSGLSTSPFTQNLYETRGAHES